MRFVVLALILAPLGALSAHCEPYNVRPWSVPYPIDQDASSALGAFLAFERTAGGVNFRSDQVAVTDRCIAGKSTHRIYRRRDGRRWWAYVRAYVGHVTTGC